MANKLRPILKQSEPITFKSNKSECNNMFIVDDKLVRLFNLKIMTKEELYRQKKSIINFDDSAIKSKKKKKINDNNPSFHRVMYNCEINKEIIQEIIQLTNEFFSQIELEFDSIYSNNNHHQDANRLITLYRKEFIPKLRNFLKNTRDNRVMMKSGAESNFILHKSYFTLR